MGPQPLVDQITFAPVCRHDVGQVHVAGGQTGVLPKPDTSVQHEDTVYVAAVSGTVSDVTAAAAAPPQEG